MATPEDFFLEPFTVSGGGASTITIQTFGYGGGTNAAGMAIPAGGFDSLLALFSGPPETILTARGNPIASVPGSTQVFDDCPPARTVLIGGNAICGDDRLTATLSPGTYTLLLSDANFLPFALSPGPPISSLLSDGFVDLSGGVFQTCTSSGACITDNGNFAVDIGGVPATSVSEPGNLALLISSVAALVYKRKRDRGNTSEVSRANSTT